MTIVDSYLLQYEVVAEYPYSTHICDTEEDAKAVIEWEYEVHGVGCTVRVIGPKAYYRGFPDVQPRLAGR